MEEMIRDRHTDRDQTINTFTTSFPTWKLYENPFYNSQQKQHKHHHHRLHNIHFRPSARKIAASLWNITFNQSIMGSELEIALTQITELKAKLALERKARKRVETLNKKLSEKLLEEKKRREAVEHVSEKLAREIASDKSDIERLKRGMEEERKMLRVAEVLREERVQMKLTEAKILFQEKIYELQLTKGEHIEISRPKVDHQRPLQMGFCEKSNCNSSNGIVVGWSKSCKRRLASPEAENPHIKRGIKGFVEFPRVVRAISSRGRQLGSKLEFQKAQLRLLLRQKSSIQPDSLLLD